MLNRLPASQRLQFSIGLPLRDTNTLTNLVHQLYTPGSANFHHYLTPAQFAERFGPAQQDYQNVMNYAKSNHLEIVGTYGNRALLDVAGNVADIENMFQIHLGTYQHPTENRQFFAPDVEPSVDPNLSISYVVGLDNYILPHPLLHDSVSGAGQGDYFGAGTGTNGWYQGNDFRNAYVPAVPLNGSGQVVGLFELDSYYPGNITYYESLAGLPNVPLQHITLPNAPTTPGGNNDEVCIDIEMVVSMAQGLSEVLVVEGYTGVDAMNEFASPPTASRWRCRSVLPGDSAGRPSPNRNSSKWPPRDSHFSWRQEIAALRPTASNPPPRITTT